jgi:hypothetical protein
MCIIKMKVNSNDDNDNYSDYYVNDKEDLNADNNNKNDIK